MNEYIRKCWHFWRKRTTMPYGKECHICGLTNWAWRANNGKI